MVDWNEARKACLRVAGRCAPAGMAEDVAQEALLRAWRHQARLRDSERAGPWLAQIVRNEAARARDKLRDEDALQPANAIADDDPKVASAPARLDVQRALQGMEELDRTLIDLRYQGDLTQAAIAERLDLPEGTVKTRLHRARKKLQEELSQ